MGLAGFGWRRTVAHRLVLLAVFATVLLTATLLSMTSLYAAAVTESGLRAALAGAPLPDRTLQVRVPIDDKASYDEASARVTTALDSAFDVVGVTVHGSATSASFGFAGAARDADELVVLAFYDHLRSHATLVRGRWPGESSVGPVQVALPLAAARRLDVQPGASVGLVNRLSDERLEITVTGVFVVRRPTGTFWAGDDLVDGVQSGSSFTTYGPLVAPRTTFLSRLAAGASAEWRAEPDFSGVTTGDLAVLEKTVPALGGGAVPGTLGEDALVVSGLPDLVRDVARPLVVLRSTITVPVALLVLLAAAALALSTRLLADHRAADIELLGSRGLSAGQLASATLREGLVVALPAGLLGPPLAVVLLRVCNGLGPFAGDGVAAWVPPTASSWQVAAAVVVVACGLLVAGAWSRGSNLRASRQSRGRPPRVSSLQRAGGDAVLAAVAALAYWQLTRYGSPVVGDPSGGLAVDPLLVAAPALVLLAAVVLLLRLLPLASGGLDGVARRTRGAPAALAIWQLSRRARAHTGPATLLALATAAGVFSLVFADTWSVSRQDQADFATGADLRLTSVPPAVTTADLERLPGAAGVTPVLRAETTLGGSDAVVLGVDPRTAGQVMVVRPDLADQPSDALTSGLATSPGPALVVPAAADTLVLPLRVSGDGPRPPAVDVFVVVRDAAGLLHRLPAGTVGAGPGARPLVVHLGDLDAVGMVAVEARTDGVSDAAITVRLGPPRARAAGHDLGPLVGASGTRWRLVSEQTAGGSSGRLLGRPSAGETVRADLFTGCCEPVTYTVLLTGQTSGSPLPALVSAGLDDLIGSAEVVVLNAAGTVVELRVAGVMDAVPTVDPATTVGAVVDLAALSDLVYRQSGQTLAVDEWWVDLSPAASAAATAAAARDDPALAAATVLSRTADVDAAGGLGDPVGAGVSGALGIGVLAAGAFAAAGFTLAVLIAVRSRRGELAVLNAVGVGRATATRLLLVEQAVVVALGVGVGVLVGLAVARLVLPAITLTPAATEPFPDVTVTTPWFALALFATAVVGVVAGVVALVVSRDGRRETAVRLWGDE